ncbi:MAG: polysaccharide deacetylase family protein [Candidatus Portnoybacteria bacterium]|nr:polysaccharide deacetylase family protein [Candidatus Portnoybacteria bacterium]
METRKVVSIWMIILAVTFMVTANSAAYEPPAKCTIFFDDGQRSIYDIALPIMAARNLKAVICPRADWMGLGEGWVMNWEEVSTLKTQYKWEVTSHGIDHPDFTTLSDPDLEWQMIGSKDAFADHNIIVRGIATPFGAYNGKVLSAIARNYFWHRTADAGVDSWPYNDYMLKVIEPKRDTPPEDVITQLQDAFAQGQWPKLLFHNLVDGVPLDYQYNSADFAQIMDFIQAERDRGAVKVVTVTQGLRLPAGNNLVPNSSFENLKPNGWPKNWWLNDGADSSKVFLDNANHGNFPKPKNSIKIIGDALPQGIQSAKIAVSSNSEYIVKMFQNVQDLVAGGWSVHVDEFDSSGAYIGTRCLGNNWDNFFDCRYYEYQPSVKAVKTAIIISTWENSELTLRVDSVEFRRLN